MVYKLSLILLFIYTTAHQLEANEETHSLSRIIFKEKENSHKCYSPIDAQTCLDEHNNFRQYHAVPNLVYNEKIATYAKQRVDYMLKTGQFEHAYGPYGENMIMAIGMDEVNCSLAVSAWYSEIDIYDFENPEQNHIDGKEVGHFTQLVWASTLEYGCASSSITSKEKIIYFVCNYDPPGNVIGEYRKNVFPPFPNYKI